MPAAVYLHADDDDETTLYLSPYFETLTGYPNDSHSPFRSYPGWVACLHPDDRDRILREGASRDRTPGHYLLEYRFRRADGAYIWVNDIYSSMLGADGQPRPELFLGDRLHLNAEGYALWQRIIALHLKG